MLQAKHGIRGEVYFAIALLCVSAQACRKSSPPEPQGQAGGENEGGSTTNHGGQPTGQAGAEPELTAPGAASAGGATASAFWREPALWDPVPTHPSCKTRVARAPETTWPPLAFTPCGSACRVAPILAAEPGAVANILGSASRTEAEGLALSLTIMVEHVSLIVAVEYGTGRATALVAEDGKCIAQLAGRASPNLFMTFPSAGDLEYKLAWRDATASTLTWLQRLGSASFNGFDTGNAWGGIQALSRVMVASDPRTLEMTEVYASQGVVRAPAAHRGVAAWAELVGTNGSVLTWNEKDGARVAASGAWSAASVGVSSSKLVWLAGVGARASEGAYDSAQFYWCDAGSASSNCKPAAGPTLSVTSAKNTLVTHGRWAATAACTEAGCEVYLLDMEASAAYRIPSRVADHGSDVLAVTATELFVADFSPARRGTPDFDSIVRYDLTKLAEFATAL